MPRNLLSNSYNFVIYLKIDNLLLSEVNVIIDSSVSNAKREELKLFNKCLYVILITSWAISPTSTKIYNYLTIS